ncbi:hypothetical protein NPIL_94771 [Nephila pilipes]|uniref:Uncharacterized protein n=1 Tax=Nephila pilipes TaxID=299642 RepID=A0A8X6QEZ1_NEPPI|nr:hypothetical protein NPIL_94771 [Nephila pilipes]
MHIFEKRIKGSSEDEGNEPHCKRVFIGITTHFILCCTDTGCSIMDTIKDESPRGSEHEDEGKISSAAILKEKFKPFR